MPCKNSESLTRRGDDERNAIFQNAKKRDNKKMGNREEWKLQSIGGVRAEGIIMLFLLTCLN